MLLRYSIPLITASLLVCTVVVNLLGLSTFSPELISTYISEIEVQPVSTADPTLIFSLLQSGKLDAKTRKEYEEIIADLGTLTQSLSAVASDPQAYLGSGNTDTKVYTELAKKSPILTGIKMIQDYVLGGKFDISTPEGKFVWAILVRMWWLNALWICIVLFAYFSYIRRVFTPIGILTQRVDRFVETKEYIHLDYAKNDEFTPLVHAINNLSTSLSRQETIRSQFLADISHEIRTPITAVTCYIEALEDGVMQMDSSTYAMLKKELSRLTKITGEIMNFSRTLETENIQIQKENIDIHTSIYGIYEEYMPRLQATNQYIKNISTAGTYISFDSDMWVQVVHNIVSNFIKYAWTGTTLQVEAVHSDTRTVIVFEDDGTGVPAEHIPYLMEKFFKVDTARTQHIGEVSSMGIWLSVVEKIVKLHGGFVSIESPDGTGFVLRIDIPRGM